MTCSRTSGTPRRGHAATSSPATSDTLNRTRNPHSVVTTSIDRLRSLVCEQRRPSGASEHGRRGDVRQSSSSLSQTIRLRRGNGFDAALSVVKTDRGRAYMDRVRDEIAAMGAEENATRVRLKDGLQAALKGSDAHLHAHVRSGLGPSFRRPFRARTQPQGASPTRRLVIGDAPQHGRCGDCDRR